MKYKAQPVAYFQKLKIVSNCESCFTI